MGVFDGFAGDLVGGAVSAFGAAQQQSQSKQMAKKAFQRNLYMSNTAHQREVDDLKQAGLNPLLSINKGASSPQAPMPTAQNIAGAGVQTALQSKRLGEEIKTMQSNRLLNDSQRNLNRQKETTEEENTTGQFIQNELNLLSISEAKALSNLYSGNKGSYMKAYEKIFGSSGPSSAMSSFIKLRKGGN